jgi:hypothetical protein
MKMLKKLLQLVITGILLAACSTNQTITPTQTNESTWEDLPIMPNTTGNSKSPAQTGYTYTIYSYTTDVDIDAVEKFYLDAMKSAGWELLGKGDMNGQDFKGVDLWYSKSDKVVSIQIADRNNTTYVSLVPEQ